MAISNLTTVAFVLKKKFSGDKPADLALRDHPTATMLRKVGGFSGLSAGWAYAVRYGNPQGISGTFATALTSVASDGASNGVQFLASRVSKFGIVQMNGEALRATRDDAGAFLDLVSMEVGGVLEEHGDDLSFQLHRDGNAQRGRRSSESSDVTTLTIADEARNFKVGMTVIASANADMSSPRTGSTQITSVDEDAGTIGLDTSAITSYSDNDYLARAGDASTFIDGLGSIIPQTAPSVGESYRGVDRSVHARLLSGVRIDDTATTIEENAGLCCVKIAQSSKRPARGTGVLVLNPIKFWEVCRRLGAKVEYGDKGSPTYGFEGFDIATPAGTIRAISDPDAPTNRGRILSLKTWYWKTLDEWVHLIKDDGGGTMLRVYNADSVEARTRSMGNLVCTDPGGNATFTI